jgi:hypothetical protein
MHCVPGCDSDATVPQPLNDKLGCLRPLTVANERVVRSKRGPAQRYPLKHDVARNVVNYIKNRPLCSCAQLFVTLQSPYRAISKNGVCKNIPFHLTPSLRDLPRSALALTSMVAPETWVDIVSTDLLKVLHQPNIVVPGCGHDRKVTSIGRWQAIHF